MTRPTTAGPTRVSSTTARSGSRPRSCRSRPARTRTATRWCEARRRLGDLLLRGEPGPARADGGRDAVLERLADRDPRRPAVRGVQRRRRVPHREDVRLGQRRTSTRSGRRASATCGTRCSARTGTSSTPGSPARRTSSWARSSPVTAFVGLDEDTAMVGDGRTLGGHRPVQDPRDAGRRVGDGTRRATCSSSRCRSPTTRRERSQAAEGARARRADRGARARDRPDPVRGATPTPRSPCTSRTRSRCSSRRSCRRSARTRRSTR